MIIAIVVTVFVLVAFAAAAIGLVLLIDTPRRPTYCDGCGVRLTSIESPFCPSCRGLAV